MLSNRPSIIPCPFTRTEVPHSPSSWKTNINRFRCRDIFFRSSQTLLIHSHGVLDVLALPGLSTYLVAYSNSTLHFRRLAAKLSPAFSRHICPVQLLSESNVWKKKRNPHSNFSSRLGFSKEIDFLIDVTQFYLLRHSVRSRHTSKGAKRRTPDDSSPSPLMDFESFKPEFFEIRRFDVCIQQKTPLLMLFAIFYWLKPICRSNRYNSSLPSPIWAGQAICDMYI